MMTKSQPKHASFMRPGSGPARPFLQRKCACGQQSSDESQKKQKQSQADMGKEQAARTEEQKIFRAAAQPKNFGHDFGRVQVRSELEHANPGATASPGQPFASQRSSLESSADDVKKQVFHCPPAGDSITKVSAATGGGGTLGFTKIDRASQLICSPRFDVDAKAGFCTFKPVTVSLSLTSKFSNPGPAAATSDTLKLPECGNKDVPIFTEITPAISALAQQGEQEHCDDLTISFNQTLLPCSTELNKFAGQKIPGKSDDECFKSLKAKMGFDPDACTLEFADLTKKDNERDDKGFHDFDPVLISKDCNKIVSGNKKSATNKIGDPSVAPSKFIPASTKCPKAAAPPPPATTSSSGSPGTPPPVPNDPKKKE
jgi:hypothetical protein